MKFRYKRRVEKMEKSRWVTRRGKRVFEDYKGYAVYKRFSISESVDDNWYGPPSKREYNDAVKEHREEFESEGRDYSYGYPFTDGSIW